MTLYYTPRLRRYNACILNIGQTSLAIPPGQSSWVHEGSCSSRCPNKIFRGDIQVFQVLNHMHYLGIRQNVTLTRSGGQFEVLADNPFSYDSPEAHVADKRTCLFQAFRYDATISNKGQDSVRHNPPVTIRPGDELTTSCTYQSRSRAKTTLYGQGSFEEMCFAFLFYFPQEIIGEYTYCGQFEDADSCTMDEVCNRQMYNSSAPATSAAIHKVKCLRGCL